MIFFPIKTDKMFKKSLKIISTPCAKYTYLFLNSGYSTYSCIKNGLLLNSITILTLTKKPIRKVLY